MEDIQEELNNVLNVHGQNENPRELFDALQELIAEHPMRVDLRHTLSLFLLKMGEFDAALTTTNDALTMLYVQGPGLPSH